MVLPVGSVVLPCVSSLLGFSHFSGSPWMARMAFPPQPAGWWNQFSASKKNGSNAGGMVGPGPWQEVKGRISKFGDFMIEFD